MQRAQGSEGLVRARGGEARKIFHCHSDDEASCPCLGSSAYGVEASSSRCAGAFNPTREDFIHERHHSKVFWFEGFAG
jgi:hypothetical protein